LHNISAVFANSYIYQQVIFIATFRLFWFNSSIAGEGGFDVCYSKKAMKKFYYQIWLPFTLNKKRILFLAIVSYIALC